MNCLPVMGTTYSRETHSCGELYIRISLDKEENDCFQCYLSNIGSLEVTVVADSKLQTKTSSEIKGKSEFRSEVRKKDFFFNR